VTGEPRPRVSSVHPPDDYIPPGRPPESAGAGAQDAYRQTRFLLDGDLDLFAQAMRLQLALVKDAYPSRYRTHALAAVLALWSRAYAHLADGMLLVSRGSYASTPPLARSAAELIAAQEGLRAGEMRLHDEWLAGTLAPDEEFKAFEIKLGRYFSGEVLATDAALRAVYRPASELSRPAFGASLLLVGPESNNNRLAVTFAEASFHLGWAEIGIGWLLALALRQAKVALDATEIIPAPEERRRAYEELERRIGEALGRHDRCRIEEVAQGNDIRYLVQNFRRGAGGTPRRILL